MWTKTQYAEYDREYRLKNKEILKARKADRKAGIPSRRERNNQLHIELEKWTPPVLDEEGWSEEDKQYWVYHYYQLIKKNR